MKKIKGWAGRGQGLVEYSLILLFVVVVVLGAGTFMAWIFKNEHLAGLFNAFDSSNVGVGASGAGAEEATNGGIWEVAGSVALIVIVFLLLVIANNKIGLVFLGGPETQAQEKAVTNQFEKVTGRE